MADIKDHTLKALEALLSLHEPEGRFQPSHFKPILKQAREAVAIARGREIPMSEFARVYGLNDMVAARNEALEKCGLVAHFGGLNSMSETDALNVVRRLTATYVDPMMPRETARRLIAKIEEEST